MVLLIVTRRDAGATSFPAIPAPGAGIVGIVELLLTLAPCPHSGQAEGGLRSAVGIISDPESPIRLIGALSPATLPEFQHIL
jgi:hypothetical protein